MSFSLVITEGQMTETDYETLLDKLAVDVRERSAGDFAIFARIAVECTGRALWTGSLSNGGTISKVIQAIEVYSDYNRGKGPRCGREFGLEVASRYIGASNGRVESIWGHG